MIVKNLRWYGFWLLDALHGRPVRKYYTAVRDSWRNGTSVRDTKEKINRLIDHAIDTTEFYGNYEKNFTALSDLPVVNKEIYRENYDSFRSSLYRKAKDNRVMVTSGSTGTPFQMIQNRDKINHNLGGGIWLNAAAGYTIGTKQAFVRAWGTAHKKSKWQAFEENIIMVDGTRLDEQMLMNLYRLLKEKRVKCLTGYASALEELSQYIDRENLSCDGIGLKAIIPISEAMSELTRKKLGEQFHCPVRETYSNEENGIMGLQNEEDESYRIDTESYYYEILKLDRDEPAEPGELGRIVITDLYNYAFPIIRYDNGDVAMAKREEENGKYRLTLECLYGRRNDLIYDCDGRAIQPIAIGVDMKVINGVNQFLLIQEDVKKYELLLEGKINDEGQGKIITLLHHYLGEGAVIRIRFVDRIPSLASGKRRFTENRCEYYQSHT